MVTSQEAEKDIEGQILLCPFFFLSLLFQEFIGSHFNSFEVCNPGVFNFGFPPSATVSFSYVVVFFFLQLLYTVFEG